MPRRAPTRRRSAPLQPSETKTFGDWTVRCYPVASPSPCDMYELLANKQTNQRVMSLSIAYMPSGDKHVIQIAVPLGVLIPTGLVIESDTYTSPLLHYRRCDRAGCYVEMMFDNGAVNALAFGDRSGQDQDRRRRRQGVRDSVLAERLCRRPWRDGRSGAQEDVRQTG